MKYLNFFFIALMLILFTSCVSKQQQKVVNVDMLLHNGKIYPSFSKPDFTIDAQNKKPYTVEAIAIDNGKIIFVGTNAESSKYKTKDTINSIDLDGAIIIPGLIDAHVHPVAGGIKETAECAFPFATMPDKIGEKVQSYWKPNYSQDLVSKDKNGEDVKWIVGGQWNSEFFDGDGNWSEDYFKQIGKDKPSLLPRVFLDRFSGDYAVMLRADSGHAWWGNSKALQSSGFTVPDDQKKEAIIKLKGEPKPFKTTGILYEDRSNLVRKDMPDWSMEQYMSGLKYVMKNANKLGITGMREADALSKRRLEALKKVVVDDEATTHLAAAIQITLAEDQLEGPPIIPDKAQICKPHSGSYPNRVLNISKLENLRDLYKTNHFSTNYAKVYLDGVPTPARTACMLNNLDEGYKPGTPSNGEIRYSPNQLKKILAKLDKAKFDIVVHTGGNGALDLVLKAMQPGFSSKIELAHAGFITDEDYILLEKYKENVEIGLSPAIWYPSPIIEGVLSVVKKDVALKFYPIRTLLKKQIPVSSGSDWPAAVEDMNPWVGIQTMVTRKNPDPNYKCPPNSVLQPSCTFGYSERISLNDALRIYTLNNAVSMNLEKETGTLEVGKYADLVVLDKDSFTKPITVSEKDVLMTLFKGKVVFRKSSIAINGNTNTQN